MIYNQLLYYKNLLLNYLIDLLSLDSFRGNKSLDLGRFNSIFTLGSLEGSSDDGLLDEDGIIFLLQTEQFLDVVGSLGTKLSGESSGGKTFY